MNFEPKTHDEKRRLAQWAVEQYGHLKTRKRDVTMGQLASWWLETLNALEKAEEELALRDGREP